MKSTTSSAFIAALASTAFAQPHAHGHQHPARALHKHTPGGDRNFHLVTEVETEWVTETVTEYIDSTTTQLFTPSKPTGPATTLATVTTSATPSSSAGQFFEGSSSFPSTYVPHAETPSSISSSSSSSSSSYVYVAPPAPTTTTSSSSVYVAPTTSTTPVEETPTTTSSTYVAPTTTSEAAPAVTTAAAVSTSDDSVTAKVDAVLGTGAVFGDLTYYTLGLGACGVDNSGEDMTANIVAMSYVNMGTESNDNPMCGKTIKIYNSNNGKSAIGIIQDKCMGCDEDSIDVSEGLFEQLADVSEGRVHDVYWVFE